MHLRVVLSFHLLALAVLAMNSQVAHGQPPNEAVAPSAQERQFIQKTILSNDVEDYRQLEMLLSHVSEMSWTNWISSAQERLLQQRSTSASKASIKQIAQGILREHAEKVHKARLNVAPFMPAGQPPRNAHSADRDRMYEEAKKAILDYEIRTRKKAGVTALWDRPGYVLMPTAGGWIAIPVKDGRILEEDVKRARNEARKEARDMNRYPGMVP
jgi:hypothetical protein